jgi:AraC-like DNA-binding protein
MPDIPSLCRESGFSHNYLLTAYKKAFHETMGRTLLNKRIEYAIELLKQSDLPVSQICQRCGFSDVSNFYRVFRRETNCSPNSCRDGKDMK